MSEKYQWLHLRSIDTTGSYLAFVVVKDSVRRRSTTNGYRPIYTVNYCVIPYFTHTKDTNHPATTTTYILISHIYTVVFFFFQERSQYMYAGFTPIQFNFTISFQKKFSLLSNQPSISFPTVFLLLLPWTKTVQYRTPSLCHAFPPFLPSPYLPCCC